MVRLITLTLSFHFQSTSGNLDLSPNPSPNSKPQPTPNPKAISHEGRRQRAHEPSGDARKQQHPASWLALLPALHSSALLVGVGLSGVSWGHDRAQFYKGLELMLEPTPEPQPESDPHPIPI